MDWRELAIDRGRTIDRLLAKNNELKKMMLPPGSFPTAWELTPSEQSMLSMLSVGGEVSVKAFSEVVGLSTDSVRVTMYKLRKKLAPRQITVSTAWGWGYFLYPEQLKRVRHYMRYPGREIGEKQPVAATEGMLA